MDAQILPPTTTENPWRDYYSIKPDVGQRVEFYRGGLCMAAKTWQGEYQGPTDGRVVEYADSKGDNAGWLLSERIGFPFFWRNVE